ncbi:MAG: serine protease [Thermodesulfobacteriota bacterium]
MDERQLYKRIKAATVAFASMVQSGKTPFTIIGSGFCVDPSGIVVTCEHVLSAFMSKTIHEQIAELPPNVHGDKIRKTRPFSVLHPFVLFYQTEESKQQLFVAASGVDITIALTDYDVAVVRVPAHPRFANGYPAIEIEDYESIQEGDEIGTCGFPLGNYLYNQLGTVTSSFTKGIISSIIPAPGSRKDLLKGFQLNLTATFGSSGGPVFSLTTGKVLGILQRGVVDANEQIIQGLVKAEPVYPIFRNDLIKRIKEGKLGQTNTLQVMLTEE